MADDCQVWQYSLRHHDWLNEDHEGTLTAFNPEHSLESLLALNIDTELE